MVVFYFLQKTQSKKDRAPPTFPDLSQDPNYSSDAELLAAAGIVVLC